jgi:hypothetical protein
MVHMESDKSFEAKGVVSQFNNTLVVTAPSSFALESQAMYTLSMDGGMAETVDGVGATSVDCDFETLDNTVPTLVSGSPNHTQINVGVSQHELLLSFSEPVTLYTGNIKVVSLGAISSGGIEKGIEAFSVKVSGSDVAVSSLDPKTVVVTIPAVATLYGDTNYTVIVDDGAIRDRGVTPNSFAGLQSGEHWFATQHTNAPKIIGTFPKNGQTDLSHTFNNIDTNSTSISMGFSMAVTHGVGNLKIAESEDCVGTVCTDYVYDQEVGSANTTSAIVKIDLIPEGSIASFELPDDSLKAGVEYKVIIPAGLFTDFGGATGGEALNSSDHSITFKTADDEAPYVVSYTPTPGKSAVSRVSPQFQFTFSEDVIVPKNSVGKKIVMKEKATGKIIFTWTTAEGSKRIPGKATVQSTNSSSTVMVLTLKETPLTGANILAKGTEYYFEMEKGIVTDNAGNEFEGIIGASTAQNVKCPGAKMDMCIMIDQSGSMEFTSRGGKTSCRTSNGKYNDIMSKCGNYDDEVKFIANVAKEFDSLLGPNQIQMTAGKFSSRTDKIFGLGQYTSAADVQNLANYKYNSGATYTKDAVNWCRNAIKYGAPGARDPADGVKKAIFIVTDGAPSRGQNPSQVAAAAYAEGTEVFMIGIGPGLAGYTLAEMKRWASPPASTHFYKPAGNSFDLSSILKPLTKTVCAQPTYSDPTTFYFTTTNVTIGPAIVPAPPVPPPTPTPTTGPTTAKPTSEARAREDTDGNNGVIVQKIFISSSQRLPLGPRAIAGPDPTITKAS